MPGIVEIIALLLSLAGFGLSPNPKAPTADQALEYAMPDADVVVHFDAASIIPGNYKVLTGLPDQPQIKASPELQKMVRQVINEVEGARGLAKSSTGIDFTTDISDGTAFVQIPAQGDPKFVVSVHGKFSTATIDKIATMTHKSATKVGAGSVVEPDRDSAIGVTKSGVLLIGTPQLVRDRVTDTWKAPARAANSGLAYAADAINTKPIYSVVLAMSATARTRVAGKMMEDGKTNFASDLVSRHKQLTFSAYANGIGWTWIDSKAGGVAQMQEFSEGIVQLLRAASVAPRGFAKVFLAGLESYRGSDKRVDELLKQKASIMKVVESFTGDGQFKSEIKAEAGANKLTVRLTGKTFSEVVPFSLAIPAIGFLTFARATPRKEATAPAEVPPPPARPTPQPKPPGTGLSKPPAKK